VWSWRRYARRERIQQQYSAIAADKLYSDVPPALADPDYQGPSAGVSTTTAAGYMKAPAAGRSPLHRPPPPPHVWQLPLPQPHDDVSAVTSSSAAYGVGSIDSRYYVLDHDLDAGSIIPTN